MEETQWYYAIDGNQVGPVAEAALAQMLATGELGSKALVWTETLEGWVEASSVEALMSPTQEPAVPTEEPQVPIPVAAVVEVVEEEVFRGYAGFWKRVAAAIIDNIVLTFAGLCIGGIAGVIYGLAVGSAGGADKLGNGIGLILGWLYFALMESSAQQATLGKMALGIKVTDLNGERISFARATGRHFSKIISAVLLLIGYLMVAFTERKQGLHDMIAGCLVVNK